MNIILTKYLNIFKDINCQSSFLKSGKDINHKKFVKEIKEKCN